MPRIKTSAKAAALYYLSPTTIGIYSYDFYDPLASDGDDENDLEAMKLRFVYSLENPVQSPEQIFTDQSDFKGRHFLIGCNPWSHHLLGYPIPEEEGGWAGNKYRDGHKYWP